MPSTAVNNRSALVAHPAPPSYIMYQSPVDWLRRGFQLMYHNLRYDRIRCDDVGPKNVNLFQILAAFSQRVQVIIASVSACTKELGFSSSSHPPPPPHTHTQSIPGSSYKQFLQLHTLGKQLFGCKFLSQETVAEINTINKKYYRSDTLSLSAVAL